MPFAARPRFTQPAKMRRRVIARPVGSSIRLKCVASGNPRPDITWLKDNKPLTPQEIGENKKKKWTLNLKNLKPEDSGKYTCRVFNKVGEINATYKVEVIRKCSSGGEQKGALEEGAVWWQRCRLMGGHGDGEVLKTSEKPLLKL